MGEELGELIRVLEREVRSTSLAADSKHTALWCVGQLPALYDKFRRTSESRYGDQAALRTLTDGNVTAPRPVNLAACIPARLLSFHQRFGVTALNLEASAAPRVRRKKAR